MTDNSPKSPPEAPTDAKGRSLVWSTEPHFHGTTGRPCTFTEEIAEKFLLRLSDGQSLRSICKQDDMPSYMAIYDWCDSHPEFAERYARAKADRAEAIFEETLDIADNATNDYMEQLGPEGQSLGWKLNGEHVQRSKLRVDARKWFLAKLLPNKYGDHVGAPQGAQTTINVLGISDQVESRLANLIERQTIDGDGQPIEE